MVNVSMLPKLTYRFISVLTKMPIYLFSWEYTFYWSFNSEGQMEKKNCKSISVEKQGGELF